MKAENPIQTKSCAFALRMVRLSRYLCDEKKEFVLSRQVVRSGTSIGANVEEAIGGQSTKDFLSKMSIACKEARETHYWLRLLRDSGILDAKQAGSVIEECGNCSGQPRINANAREWNSPENRILCLFAFIRVYWRFWT